MKISYFPFLTLQSTLVQVIGREGNVVDRDPLDSLEKYTKYTVSIYVEKAEYQQEIGDKVEEDRNTWSKPVLTFDIPKIDESDETVEDQRETVEKVVKIQEIDEKEEDGNTNPQFFTPFSIPQKIDEIQPKPKAFFHFFEVETFRPISGNKARR